MKLDTEFVRAQFPAFSDPALADWRHFENAGGSYACGQVIDRLTRFYRERKLQPYGPGAPTALGGAEMDEARDRLAGLLGVTADEVSFGPSTTQNTYVLAQAFRQMMTSGDAIIVTNQDHEANSGPWRRLADEGFEVREWKMDGQGRLNLTDLEALLDERVRLVAFPHCSNIVAEINDVTAICETIRSAGAVSCVDGVSYAPHGLPDIGKLGADIYLFSTYKTYGPHQGVMVLRNGLERDLPNQGHWFNADYPGKRLTPAGPDHAQIAACAGIADYMDALSGHHHGDSAHDLMRAREIELLTPFLDWVSGRNDVRLLGPSDPKRRAPTVALLHDEPGEVLAERLAQHGIMAGGGDFYAVRLLDALGVDPQHGVLRISFAHYTSNEDMSALVDALDAVL